jgi:hypothetical protein
MSCPVSTAIRHVSHSEWLHGCGCLLLLCSSARVSCRGHVRTEACMALSEKHGTVRRMEIQEKIVHRTFNAARHTNGAVYVC